VFVRPASSPFDDYYNNFARYTPVNDPKLDIPKLDGRIKLPQANENWLNLVKTYGKEILKNYSLTRNYIEGYYERRVLPYLAKHSFSSNSDTHLFRGMIVTIPELEHIIKNGLELNKTSWHTGAQGGKAVISFSSSSHEAQGYIFQSKVKEGTVGIVVEVKKTPSYKLLDDAELNSSKTIYHNYNNVAPEEITGISIYDGYGTGTLEIIIKKIQDGTASHSWVKDFDRMFLR
jgi:hypothetical protein